MSESLSALQPIMAIVLAHPPIINIEIKGISFSYSEGKSRLHALYFDKRQSERKNLMNPGFFSARQGTIHRYPGAGEAIIRDHPARVLAAINLSLSPCRSKMR